MRKSAFCIIWEKHRHRSAGQWLISNSVVRSYLDSISKMSSFYLVCGCIGRFVSYQVKSPEHRLSCDEARLICCFLVSSPVANYKEKETFHVITVKVLK